MDVKRFHVFVERVDVDVAVGCFQMSEHLTDGDIGETEHVVFERRKVFM